MVREHIFISYSHKDEPLLEEFLVHLKPWDERQLQLWTDKNIEAGQEWDLKIQQAIDRTAVAVLLISPDSLASDYIRQHELPPLIHAREQKDIELTCLYLRPSSVADPEHIYNLTKYQGLNQPSEVVTNHPKGSSQRDALLVSAATKLKGAFPFSGSSFQKREMRICHFFQQVPAPGLVVGAQHQHLLGILPVPKDARSLQPEVDHPPDRTFHRPAAQR